MKALLRLYQGFFWILLVFLSWERHDYPIHLFLIGVPCKICIFFFQNTKIYCFDRRSFPNKIQILGCTCSTTQLARKSNVSKVLSFPLYFFPPLFFCRRSSPSFSLSLSLSHSLASSLSLSLSLARSLTRSRARSTGEEVEMLTRTTLSKRKNTPPWKHQIAKQYAVKEVRRKRQYFIIYRH